MIHAAQGLYQLAGIQLSDESRQQRQIQLQGIDTESLLVGWLNELLFLIESEQWAFESVEKYFLTATEWKVLLFGAKIQSSEKVIKAATYNNLKITPILQGFTATIVLDV